MYTWLSCYIHDMFSVAIALPCQLWQPSFITTDWLCLVLVVNNNSIAMIIITHKLAQGSFVSQLLHSNVVGRKRFLLCVAWVWGYTQVWSLLPPPIPFFYRVQHREHLTPLQATDTGGTITIVTASGRSFTQQINTEDTAVQETSPATTGQIVLANWSILKYTSGALKDFST